MRGLDVTSPPALPMYFSVTRSCSDHVYLGSDSEDDCESDDSERGDVDRDDDDREDVVSDGDGDELNDGMIADVE